MVLSHVHSPLRRLLMFTCLCSAVVFGMANSVHAGLLLPGASIANDGVAANTGGSGTGKLLADSGYVPYSGGGVNTGFIRNIVISDPSNTLGGLVFIYHIAGVSGDLSSLNVSNFMNGGTWKTDVSAVSTAIQNPLLPIGTAPFVPGTTANGILDPANPLPLTRGVTGTGVQFNYDKTLTVAPFSTLVMIVRTNAPEFTTGGNESIQDDISTNVTSFQPTPEPASMTLLGIGLLGMGGYAWRRRKGEPVAEAQTPAV